MEKKKWIDVKILEECTVFSLHQYICHLHGNDYISKVEDYNAYAPGHFYD